MCVAGCLSVCTSVTISKAYSFSSVSHSFGQVPYYIVVCI